MIPDEDLPSDEDLPLDDGSINFPDIPTNDVGQLTSLPYGLYPDITTNDLGNKGFDGQPLSEGFPDININDRGVDSE